MAPDHVDARAPPRRRPRPTTSAPTANHVGALAETARAVPDRDDERTLASG